MTGRESALVNANPIARLSRPRGVVQPLTINRRKIESYTTRNGEPIAPRTADHGLEPRTVSPNSERTTVRPLPRASINRIAAVSDGANMRYVIEVNLPDDTDPSDVLERAIELSGDEGACVTVKDD